MAEHYDGTGRDVPGNPTVKRGAAALSQLTRHLKEETFRRKQAEEALQARTAQLKATALELAHAEQHERQRLSVVLHDHLQELLVGAQMKIALLTHATNRRELRETIREATGILDEAIAETRSLAVELSPPVLFEGGLVSAQADSKQAPFNCMANARVRLQAKLVITSRKALAMK